MMLKEIGASVLGSRKLLNVFEIAKGIRISPWGANWAAALAAQRRHIARAMDTFQPVAARQRSLTTELVAA